MNKRSGAESNSKAASCGAGFDLNYMALANRTGLESALQTSAQLTDENRTSKERC